MNNWFIWQIPISYFTEKWLDKVVLRMSPKHGRSGSWEVWL